MTKFQCYKSPMGLYIKDTIQSYGWWGVYKLNGKLATESHSKNWKFLEGETEILSLSREIEKPPKISGYSLIDPCLASDKIPLTLTPDDVGRHYDGDEYVWTNHSNLRSLYKQEYTEKEVVSEDCEFEVEYLGELSVKDLEMPHKTQITLKLVDSSSGWATKEKLGTLCISSVAEYDEIVKAVVPDLVIHHQPCTIPSHVAYEIVRGFVKNNIDTKSAVITSDYNFCFTVKKRISIKPIPWTKEVLTSRNKSYRPPRYNKGVTSFKEVEIFEMTHRKENYRGYTPIEGFSGNNLKELVDNVFCYLEELISYINTPFTECQYCNGVGHMVGESFKMNLRGSNDV